MNIAEIEQEIEKLQQGDTTYSNCTKLAVLYSVLEHEKRHIASSYAGSEFLLAVANAPIDGVLNILDEHMECIKALYPKEYTCIIRKIREL